MQKQVPGTMLAQSGCLVRWDLVCAALLKTSIHIYTWVAGTLFTAAKAYIISSRKYLYARSSRSTGVGYRVFCSTKTGMLAQSGFLVWWDLACASLLKTSIYICMGRRYTFYCGEDIYIFS